jgi:plasmid stability protein
MAVRNPLVVAAAGLSPACFPSLDVGIPRLHCLHMIQYTVRNIPEHIDQALRARAHQERKSINQLTLELLAEAVGDRANDRPKRNLASIAGSWVGDAETEGALEDQRRIDPDLWR